jgi:gliding motility-associated lipoprotein GldB
MRHIFLIFSVIFCFSCESEDQLEKEIAAIPMEVTVERFDQLFAKANEGDLGGLKRDYPFMFSKRFHDSVWVNRMKDTLQIQLHREAEKTFPNFDKETEGITSLFQHLKYYDPSFKPSRVLTVIPGDVNYRNKVVVTDTISLIALDTYLGDNHEFYVNIYDYIKQNMKPSQILPDLTAEYAKKYIFQTKRKTLLEEMVYFGKQLYFKDLMIPSYSDAEKIGYTTEQLQWARDNEEYIWQHFVENQMLFDTNPKLASRFINPAPFSKFNLELDRESPGRLGQYIGWQIVRAYMKNNEVSFKELMQEDATEIFNKSKFKPKR